MKTIGVDVHNSVSPVCQYSVFSEFFVLTHKHMCCDKYKNTYIHMHTHLYILGLCIILPVKKHAKVQKEKANTLIKLRLQGSSMDLVMKRFRFPGEHLWFTEPWFLTKASKSPYCQLHISCFTAKLLNSHYCRHVPYWQTALHHHHTPLLLGCRAGTSRLCQPAHSANMSGPAKQ